LDPTHILPTFGRNPLGKLAGNYSWKLVRNPGFQLVRLVGCGHNCFVNVNSFTRKRFLKFSKIFKVSLDTSYRAFA